MENRLMYIGVTHERATAAERACFTLNQIQKDKLKKSLEEELSITSLAIITTCNRTGIYFESDAATLDEVSQLFLNHIEKWHNVKLSGKTFLTFDRSIDTVNHLLHVANGLRSAIIGDKQIIRQVKESYLDALANGNQGSLLERAFQAVFRSHKRVSVESLYQQGSTSTAYCSLKMIEESLGKEEMKRKKVLIIGAGEIAEDILRYLPKFQIQEVFITNRTFVKAQNLAKKFDLKVYEWQHVQQNRFEQFDVIITAVSHCKSLISRVAPDGKFRLWIDLAMPLNVNPAIADTYNKIYNIDEVTEKISLINDVQLQAIPAVKQILKEELEVFSDWLQKSNVRLFLSAYKEHSKKVLLLSISSYQTQRAEQDKLELMAETMANKMVRKMAKTVNLLSAGNSAIGHPQPLLKTIAI